VQSAKISIGDVTMAEGNSGTTMMRFPVTLSAASGKTITVNYATSAFSALAPEDFIATSGTLTIPAGTTLQYISVPINGDTKYEGTEQFFMRLSTSVNATILDSAATGSITNDDSLSK
jgi:large repetitive protein